MFFSSLLFLGLAFIFHCQYTDQQSLSPSDPIPSDKPVFQAAVREDILKYFFCGGALFHPIYVLTVARCISSYLDEPHRLRVFMNVSHRLDARHSSTVEKIIIHEKYSSDQRSYDIALLKLLLILFPSPSVGFAVIPDQDTNIKNGSPVRIFRLGLIEPEHSTWQVMQTDMKIVDRRRCRQKYRDAGYYISDDQVCAYNKSVKTGCAGSIGFPLVDKKNRVIGLTTYPIRCGEVLRGGFPTVFLRVSPLATWINNHVVVESEPSVVQNPSYYV